MSPFLESIWFPPVYEEFIIVVSSCSSQAHKYTPSSRQGGVYICAYILQQKE